MRSLLLKLSTKIYSRDSVLWHDYLQRGASPGGSGISGYHNPAFFRSPRNPYFISNALGLIKIEYMNTLDRRIGSFEKWLYSLVNAFSYALVDEKFHAATPARISAYRWAILTSSSEILLASATASGVPSDRSEFRMASTL